jgi:2-polyprenyl-6-methoxyphenol hydroxylase-like FAD-dependent oxidoreductase
MKITIIGAGMAGLLAANMLRNHEVSIIEAQKELPNNQPGASHSFQKGPGVQGDYRFD